jgi:hypothetical protein
MVLQLTHTLFLKRLLRGIKRQCQIIRSFLVCWKVVFHVPPGPRSHDAATLLLLIVQIFCIQLYNAIAVLVTSGRTDSLVALVGESTKIELDFFVTLRGGEQTLEKQNLVESGRPDVGRIHSSKSHSAGLGTGRYKPALLPSSITADSAEEGKRKDSKAVHSCSCSRNSLLCGSTDVARADLGKKVKSEVAQLLELVLGLLSRG